MRILTIRNTLATGVVGGLWCLAQSSNAATNFHDLTGGGSATINNAIFQTTVSQPTGTGVFNPFVRLQSHGSNTYEAGYNTAAGTPLDVLSNGNAWHKDLLLSSLSQVTVNSIAYYEFRLDLAEPSGGIKPLISLNQVEIFGSANPAPTTGVGMNSTTGRATNPSLLGSLIYDMNPAGGTADSVRLSYDLNKGGNGKGDMQLLVPVNLFTGLKYVVFYSEFGANPIASGNSADGSFEEWASLSSVPEPTTLVAGALLLLPFGASTLRIFRSKKTA